LVAVSDLNRTRQTFQEISNVQGHTHSETNNRLIFDSRLREKGGGVLEGSPLHTFKKESEKSGVALRLYAPKGGERWQDVMDRAESFI
jgi:broad specificity phosphatase PhoE